MKQIPNFENYYITENGNIVNIKTNRQLVQVINKIGYCQVTLSKNGKSKSLRVHRLIAEAFIPNPKNKKCVNHINGIKTDNRLENLEWNTAGENLRHAFINDLNKMRKKLVLDMQTGIYYESAREAALAKCFNCNILHSKLNGINKNNTSLIYA